MTKALRLGAQVLLVATAALMFTTWASANESSAVVARVLLRDVSGMERTEGQLVALVCVLTVIAVQIGWRPAWIGAAFSAMVLGRELLAARNAVDADPGIALIAGTITSLLAAALLLRWLFTTIERPIFKPDRD